MIWYDKYDHAHTMVHFDGVLTNFIVTVNTDVLNNGIVDWNRPLYFCYERNKFQEALFRLIMLIEAEHVSRGC